MDLCVGQMLWRRAWQPAPVFLPGESHGQRSLAGYSPWGRKESDTTEGTEHACWHYSFEVVWWCLGWRTENSTCYWAQTPAPGPSWPFPIIFILHLVVQDPWTALQRRLSLPLLPRRPCPGASAVRRRRSEPLVWTLTLILWWPCDLQQFLYFPGVHFSPVSEVDTPSSQHCCEDEGRWRNSLCEPARGLLLTSSNLCVHALRSNSSVFGKPAWDSEQASKF